MSIKLKIYFRKSAIPGNPIYMMIGQQTQDFTETLPFHTEFLTLKSSVAPQASLGELYLRGADGQQNYRQLNFSENYQHKVLRTLYEYSVAQEQYLYIKFKGNYIELTIQTDQTFGLVRIHSSINSVEYYNQCVEALELRNGFNDLIHHEKELEVNNNDMLNKTTTKKKIVPQKYSCSTCNKNNITADKMYSGGTCIKCYENLPKCDVCKNKAVSKLNIYDDKKLGKLSVCSKCYKFYECETCKDSILISFIKNSFYIDENGRDQITRSCNNCTVNHIRCGSCGNSYDTKKYYTCPCKIPNSFKKMIHPWNENVLNHLPLDEGTKELFGLELEVGVHVKNRVLYKEVADYTKNIINGDAIMLYDSSIDYLDGSAKQKENKFRGFEIVTRPLTYNNMVRFIKHVSETRHPVLKCWEVGTTGIHIHVNKKFLTNSQIGKILVFINDKRNRKFIKMIAKREDNKYAKFVPRTLADYNDKSAECHYYAINTNKEATIEFRIFRGTLNVTTMLSYIQFVRSLIEYIKISKFDKLEYSNYVEWLFNNTTEYHELFSRIRREDLENINEEGQI